MNKLEQLKSELLLLTKRQFQSTDFIAADILINQIDGQLFDESSGLGSDSVELNLIENDSSSSGDAKELCEHMTTHHMPLMCNNLTIGQLRLTTHALPTDDDEISISFQTHLRLLTQQIEAILLRFSTHSKTTEKDLSRFCWIGYSAALKQVEELTLKFSGVDFPVLISGERGTGKVAAAYAIHGFSARHEHPFVELCCLNWELESFWQDLQESYQHALGGTLYLRNINAIPNDQIIKIRHFWEQEYINHKVPVRVVCSLSSQYDNDYITSSTAPWLRMELPTLSQRRADIEPLIKTLLNKYSSIEPISLKEECLALLCQHQWKDNVKGLERVIALLSVMVDEKEVDVSNLLEIAPELEPNDLKNSNKAEHSQIFNQYDEGQCQPQRSSCNTTNIDTAPEDKMHKLQLPQNAQLKQPDQHKLVQQLVDQHLVDFPTGHAAVTRSLNLLAQEYGKKITLEEMAGAAFVSPAHLSFLFRKHLGISFKQLLLQMRIEKSKRLLAERSDMQVTQISYEVGFHDLSHFERTFRKLVGIKPLQYRSKEFH